MCLWGCLRFPLTPGLAWFKRLKLFFLSFYGANKQADRCPGVPRNCQGSTEPPLQCSLQGHFLSLRCGSSSRMGVLLLESGRDPQSPKPSSSHTHTPHFLPRTTRCQGRRPWLAASGTVAHSDSGSLQSILLAPLRRFSPKLGAPGPCLDLQGHLSAPGHS